MRRNAVAFGVGERTGPGHQRIDELQKLRGAFGDRRTLPSDSGLVTACDRAGERFRGAAIGPVLDGLPHERCEDRLRLFGCDARGPGDLLGGQVPIMFADLVAAAKKDPGKITMGSSGTGTVSHLTLSSVCRAAGIDITHVPYRGSGPALNDAVGGQVPVIIDNLPSALPFIKSAASCPSWWPRPSGSRPCPKCPPSRRWDRN